MVGVLQGSVGQVNDLGGCFVFYFLSISYHYPFDLGISVYPTHSPSGAARRTSGGTSGFASPKHILCFEL